MDAPPSWHGAAVGAPASASTVLVRCTSCIDGVARARHAGVAPRFTALAGVADCQVRRAPVGTGQQGSFSPCFGVLAASLTCAHKVRNAAAARGCLARRGRHRLPRSHCPLRRKAHDTAILPEEAPAYLPVPHVPERDDSWVEIPKVMSEHLINNLERPALYMVATPIGNHGDISLRALQVLQHVDVLYAEDTRELRTLLSDLGVPTGGRSMLQCHDHNESTAAAKIVRHLEQGRSVALVSDAGTPLISDPGFVVLRTVREQLASDVPIRPVPGPCAAIAALSIGGAPTNRFLFAGFAPAKPAARATMVRELLQQATAGKPATAVLYESPHRIVSTLELLVEILEEEGSAATRHVAICRELTKTYETVLRGTARQVLAAVQEDPMQQKGEFVILVEGGKKSDGGTSSVGITPNEVMRLLCTELPKGKAARLASRICGIPKDELRKKPA